MSWVWYGMVWYSTCRQLVGSVRFLKFNADRLLVLMVDGWCGPTQNVLFAMGQSCKFVDVDVNLELFNLDCLSD